MTEWKRVKIGEVCRIEKGATGIASATPGDYPLVVTALERKTCSTYQFDCEAVCIPLVSSSGHGKKSLKYVHYQNGKFALGTILAAVIPNDKNELSARYLHQFLQFYKDTLIVPLMHGAANVSLAIRDIEQIEIPLPPIEKQNEFAKLFVRMQENDVELQSEFETQKDLIKKLRQSILQDAIEGKLTEDWRKEMPRGFEPPNGVSLNENFKDFALAKSNPRGNKKTLPPITDEEKPFEIPKSWKWVRLGEIAETNLGKMLDTYKNKGEKRKYLRNLNVRWFSFDLSDLQEMKIQSYELEKCTARKGDLLVCEGGYPGRAAIWNEDYEICFQKAIHRIRFNSYPNMNILFNYYLFFLSETGKIEQYLTGAGIKHLTGKELKNIVFPLPPLAEQNEIVRRVENQLAKVEQLEQQVQKREKLTKSLFRGILKNAFEGEKCHADSAPLTRMPT